MHKSSISLFSSKNAERKQNAEFHGLLGYFAEDHLATTTLSALAPKGCVGILHDLQSWRQQ